MSTEMKATSSSRTREKIHAIRTCWAQTCEPTVVRLYVAATYGSPGFNVAELSAHAPGEEGASQHVIEVLPSPELLHNDDGRHDGSHGRWRLAYASFDILWLISFIIAGV
jgi:hypothetical protein